MESYKISYSLCGINFERNFNSGMRMNEALQKLVEEGYTILKISTGSTKRLNAFDTRN